MKLTHKSKVTVFSSIVCYRTGNCDSKLKIVAVSYSILFMKAKISEKEQIAFRLSENQAKFNYK